MKPETLEKLMQEYASWRMRNEAKLSGYPAVSIFYRVMTQDVVTGGTPDHGLPYAHTPRRLAHIHLAFEDLPKKFRAAVGLRYLCPGTDMDKSQSIGVSVHEFRKRVREGMTHIRGYILGLQHTSRAIKQRV